MIASWLLYAAWVAALLSLGAWAAERALRLAGRPARLLWLGAMTLSVLIPGATYAIRTWMPETALGLPSVGLSELVLPAPWGAGDAAGSGWTGQRVTELVLSAAWVAASLALLGLLAHSQWRLRRERAGWIKTRVDGVPVLVSRRTGPATVGSLRPRVVLPEWAVGLPAERREMILRHELEHVRARDGLVALVGFALAALAPWNPALWWMLSRLRLAQEMDCDRRLLAAGIPVRGYVNLLMTSGRPALGASLAAPGLSFSQSTLRKRILQMTHIPGRNSLVQATAIGAVAIGLGLLACDTPAPGDTEALTGPAASVVAPDDAGEWEFGAAEAARRVLDKKEAWIHADGDESLDMPFGTWTDSDGNVTLDLVKLKGEHLLLHEVNEWTEADVAAFGEARDDYVKRRNELAHDVEALEEIAPDADPQMIERVKRAPTVDHEGSLLVLDGEIWEGSNDELKRRLSLGHVGEAQILAAPEAVARFGPRAANGAILIETDGN